MRKGQAINPIMIGLAAAVILGTILSHSLSQARVAADTHPAASMTALPMDPPPPTISMRHVLTGAYVNGYAGTQLPPAVVAPYVSWAANPAGKSARAVKAAGMKIYVYINPNRVYDCPSCSHLYQIVASNPALEAKACDGTPITVSKGHGFLTDPHSSDLWASFKQVADHERQAAGVDWDAYFVDDFDDVLVTDNGLPCGFDKSDWLSASKKLIDYAGIPVIFNGLSQGMSELPLVDDANVIGAMYEGCYSFRNSFGIKGDGLAADDEWRQTENIEIEMGAKQKLFWCYGQNSNPTDQSRMYQYASFLLTYSPQHSLLQVAYTTTSRLPIMPEFQIVPKNPLGSMPADISALQMPGGSYGRQYASCYLTGRLIGPCGVAINSNRTASRPYPFGSTYSHTLIFHGNGGVIEGGTVGVDGPPPPASLGPTTAVLAF
jgi:hypothetical protein